MAVTVEIKIGTRRIISYLLSPLAKYSHDSLRKRRMSEVESLPLTNNFNGLCDYRQYGLSSG